MMTANDSMARRQSRISIPTATPTAVRMLVRASTAPSLTNSVIDSMSDVIRETSTPVLASS